MRLIDADALIDFLDVGHLRHSSELCYSEIEVANLLLQAPTVEAKPVVHGEWKYDWLGEYICSNCYERVTVKEVMGEPAWDWCPACGADMRGWKND